MHIDARITTIGLGVLGLGAAAGLAGCGRSAGGGSAAPAPLPPEPDTGGAAPPAKEPDAGGATTPPSKSPGSSGPGNPATPAEPDQPGTTPAPSEPDAGGDGENPNSPCGTERWDVKTLTDPGASSVNTLSFHDTTVQAMGDLAAPAHIGNNLPRQHGVETATWLLTARLEKMKVEPDSDIHLVIADPRTGQHMIAEFPAPQCTTGTATAQREQIRVARQALLRLGGGAHSGWVALHGTATIAGVGFFDKKHGQTGHAPNYVELHPVLRFEPSRSAGRG